MPPQILIDPGTRFQCVPDCGFCCGWDTHIDKQRKDFLLQKDWVQELARELEIQKGQQLFRIVGQQGESIIQRQYGSCSFIGERKLCSIHAVEGHDAKPIVCQQYPYIYYQTPRGVEVFLDHSCPEVIQNDGGLVTSQEIKQRLSHELVQTIEAFFPLDSKTTLNWECYLCLEKTFLQVLAQPLSLEEKILCLDQVAKELCSRLGGGAFTPTVEAVEKALTDIQAGEFENILSKIKALSSSPSKRNLYLAILIHWVEASYSGEVNATRAGSAKIIQHILRQWKNVGGNSFAVFKFRANYQQLEAVAFTLDVKELRDAMDRYLRYLVKSLLGTGVIGITKRIAIISTNFALVKWFSRGYAAANGRTEISLEDLVSGIRIVEKFLSYRLFNKLSARRDFLSYYISLLFENPKLPVTMLASR
jgi:Putative zinc- or iron-chelating domain